MKELVYFTQPGDTALVRKIQNSEALIQAGDRLSVLVTALDPASVAPYNIGAPTSGTTGVSVLNGGYVVETDGTIQFPQLGKINVAGFQRKQLVDTLTQRISKYVTDPIVTVQFLNFKITVLGEVTRQGTYNIPDGKVNIIEALGLAGDLTLFSRRDNILVVREQNGVREFGRINLLSKNAFISPYFVLKQNDVVYVELTKAKVENNDQATTRYITIGFSFVSMIIALSSFLINLSK